MKKTEFDYQLTFEEIYQKEISKGRQPSDAANRARYYMCSQRDQYNSKIKHDFITKDSACVRCGKKENLSLDHIFPSSSGGKNERSNIQVLCKSCNCRKVKEDRKIPTLYGLKLKELGLTYGSLKKYHEAKI